MTSSMISSNTVLKKCKKAGINFWISARTALDLKKKMENQEIPEEELNREIYQNLKEYNEEAAERFRNYHSILIRTTDGELQPFDKTKITDSLLKETRIPRNTAKEIAEEVSEDIRRLQLHNISSALIREMVNTKLLQRRHIDEKRQYSRVGLPIYDAKKMLIEEKAINPMQLQEKFAERILEEYTLTQALPKRLSQEHLKGKIQIHNLSGFIAAPESIENNLYKIYEEGLNIPGIIETGPAKKPEVAASHAARSLLTSSQYVSGGVSINSFNFYIAPYIEDLEEKEVEQIAQTFLYELNQLSSGTTSITVNLDTKTPKSLKERKTVKKGKKNDSVYKDYEEEAKQFLNKFLKVYEKGDYKGKYFKVPEIAIKYQKNLKEELESDLNLEETNKPIYLVKQGNSKTKNEKTVTNGQLITSKHEERGIMQTISLNLLSYSKENENIFYKDLRKQMGIVEQIIEKKKQNMLLRKDKLRFIKENDLNPEELKCHLSLYGLIETAKEITGVKKINPSIVHQAKKIIREIKRESNKKGLNVFLSQKKDHETIEKFIEGKKTEEKIKKILQLSENSNEDLVEIQRYLKGGSFLESKTMRPLKSGYLYIKLI